LHVSGGGGWKSRTSIEYRTRATGTNLTTAAEKCWVEWRSPGAVLFRITHWPACSVL